MGLSTGERAVQLLAEEVRERRESLIEDFLKEGSGIDFLSENTAILDDYFRRSLGGRTLPFSLVALGGYGRRELCLHSDIDLLILLERRTPRAIAQMVQSVFYPLWDLGYELGYTVRTLRQTLELAGRNYEVLTSLLDGRFLLGREELYERLVRRIQEGLSGRRASLFRRWLIKRGEKRREKYGDASYLLEPNIKEGAGGLRDYHAMMWLAKAKLGPLSKEDLLGSGLLFEDEYRSLLKALKFIWTVRNHLHLLCRRKNDQLYFEFQERIATGLGFRDSGELPAVEAFMGRLHEHMYLLKVLSKTLLLRIEPPSERKKGRSQDHPLPAGLVCHDGEISFVSKESIAEDPLVLFEIFHWSCRTGLSLSLEGRRWIRESLHLVDDGFRGSPSAFQEFMNIICSPHRSFEALDEMMETGLLEAYLPEFGQIRNRVQHDAYHLFPVDRHSLLTLKELKDLAAGRAEKGFPLLRDLFREIRHPERLLLAALLHDIGKGSGSDHARKGYKITRALLKRMQVDEEASEAVAFLVRHHLLLVETATRRDLFDEKAVVLCAGKIRDVESLKMLFLLTWADSIATGPKAWNDWIATLTQELFFKILHILEGGELATADVARRVKVLRSDVAVRLPGLSAEELRSYFDLMSTRYLISTPAREIARHIRLHKRLRDRTFVWHLEKKRAGNYWEVSICTRDRHGLFSRIAGVFALNDMNILSAQINTWRNNVALDVFHVSNPPDPLMQLQKWRKVRHDLEHTLKGELELDKRLKEKAIPSVASRRIRSKKPSSVIVDNDSSDFFTIIEVYSLDYIGLLYRITNALYSLKLDIQVAKISTKVDQAVDVFYVTDYEGQKVEDPKRVEEIKKTVLEAL